MLTHVSVLTTKAVNPLNAEAIRKEQCHFGCGDLAHSALGHQHEPGILIMLGCCHLKSLKVFFFFFFQKELSTSNNYL